MSVRSWQRLHSSLGPSWPIATSYQGKGTESLANHPVSQIFTLVKASHMTKPNFEGPGKSYLPSAPKGKAVIEFIIPHPWWWWPLGRVKRSLHLNYSNYIRKYEAKIWNFLTLEGGYICISYIIHHVISFKLFKTRSIIFKGMGQWNFNIKNYICVSSLGPYFLSRYSGETWVKEFQVFLCCFRLHGSSLRPQQQLPGLPPRFKHGARISVCTCSLLPMQGLSPGCLTHLCTLSPELATKKVLVNL